MGDNNGDDGDGAVGTVQDSGGGGWPTATALMIWMNGLGGRRPRLLAALGWECGHRCHQAYPIPG